MESSKKNYEKRMIVEGKKIGKRDFLKMIKEINDIKQYKNGTVSVEVIFDDNSRITGEEEDIFDMDDLTDKNAKCIVFHYRSGDYNTKIVASFNTDDNAQSYINICSDDRKLYQATIQNFEDIIDKIDNQRKIWKIFKGVSASTIASFFALGGALEFLFNMDRLDNKLSILISISILIAMFFILKISVIIIDMFPCIEFLFDNKVNKKNLSRKKIILYILGYVFANIPGFLFFIFS